MGLPRQFPQIGVVVGVVVGKCFEPNQVAAMFAERSLKRSRVADAGEPKQAPICESGKWCRGSVGSPELNRLVARLEPGQRAAVTEASRPFANRLPRCR